MAAGAAVDVDFAPNDGRSVLIVYEIRFRNATPGQDVLMIRSARHSQWSEYIVDDVRECIIAVSPGDKATVTVQNNGPDTLDFTLQYLELTHDEAQIFLGKIGGPVWRP